jgi:hypothetical protein
MRPEVSHLLELGIALVIEGECLVAWRCSGNSKYSLLQAGREASREADLARLNIRGLSTFWIKDFENRTGGSAGFYRMDVLVDEAEAVAWTRLHKLMRYPEGHLMGKHGLNI